MKNSKAIKNKEHEILQAESALDRLKNELDELTKGSPKDESEDIIEKLLKIKSVRDHLEAFADSLTMVVHDAIPMSMIIYCEASIFFDFDGKIVEWDACSEDEIDINDNDDVDIFVEKKAKTQKAIILKRKKELIDHVKQFLPKGTKATPELIQDLLDYA